MSDPLAAFRKKGAVAQDATEKPPTAREPFKAFATKDKLRCLDIRTKSGGLAHAVSYTYLTTISYDRHTYGEVLLTLNRMIVVIKGRNLRPIVDALKLHTCEFIQEFDAQEFDEPSDKAAPFVDSIEVKMFGAAAEVSSDK